MWLFGSNSASKTDFSNPNYLLALYLNHVIHCCDCAGYEGNCILSVFRFSVISLALLEVKLVPEDCMVLVHDFGNANRTEFVIQLIRCEVLIV